ncbi:hypothetical protein ADEAN_000296800 [Angomonas deanei]|uniref:Uncharacterized protein n=1 Tax=Angomonas deanei TaxID=59799 RepID=A0A7G2C9S4_9TRYP|nr:hypothetical protein ADEAN_000296800 [Angomonas deanei]
MSSVKLSASLNNKKSEVGKANNNSSRKVNHSGVESRKGDSPDLNTSEVHKNPLEESKKSGSGKQVNDTTFSLPLVSGGTANSGVGNSQSKVVGASHPSLAFTQQRRKKNGATTTTLFFNNPGSAVSDPSAKGKNTGVSGSATSNPDPAADGPDAESSLMNVLSGALENVPTPNITKLTKKPAVITLFLFLYFLLISIFLLSYGSEAVEGLAQSQSEYNGQLVTFSAALYNRVLEMEQGLGNHSANDTEAEQLARVQFAYQHAAAGLHQSMKYPGPEEEIRFLLESHVHYNRQVRQLAQEELEWFNTARVSLMNRNTGLKDSKCILNPFRATDAIPSTSEERKEDANGDKVQVNKREQPSYDVQNIIVSLLQNKFVVFFLFTVLLITFLKL